MRSRKLCLPAYCIVYQADLLAIDRALSEILNCSTGCCGNERADQLAKEAALSSRGKPDDVCPVSLVKHQIRSDSLDEWNHRYQSGHNTYVTKCSYRMHTD